MPDVQEVFRMATQKVRPDPGALERQHRNQRRQVSKRKAGVYALVAGLVVAGLIVGGSALRRAGDPASGGGLTTGDLIGVWVRSGTGSGDDGFFVKFDPDGTFAAAHFEQLLYSGNSPAVGTYELADGTITFKTDERSGFCRASETWVWEAELLSDGRLGTVAVDDATGYCQVGLGVEWTWVGLSSGT